MLYEVFWVFNTSRGKYVVTADLVAAMIQERFGAGLDVLEYEKLSFETLFKRTIHLKRFDTY
jgi:D-3-phosphoglycerate dehydrogenase